MNIYNKFRKAIDGAQNIVITTHLYPDADGIGSQIALSEALDKLGKRTICCNEEPLLERYKYLDPRDCVTHLDKLDGHFKTATDLIIVVDTNTIFRAGHRFVDFAQKIDCPILYIDHHPCKEETSKAHCIDTTTAATGQLVGELIEESAIEFTQSMALALYTSILIDTSSFRYPTVTAKTHALIAKLMDTGIKPPAAYNGIYGTKSIDHLHMLGTVLATADSNANADIAWISLKKKDLEKFNTDIEDTHGFINHLLILDNIKVACMFRDDGDQVKISFRSSGAYDVGILAVHLGGGGHSHSAATLIPKPEGKDMNDVIEDSVKKMEKILAIDS